MKSPTENITDDSTASDTPLLLPARDAAALCGTSERTWRTWDAGGLVPQPVRIGRSVFWRRSELQAWVERGCPSRKTWNAMTQE